MNKALTILAFFAFVSVSFASSSPKKTPLLRADEIYLPVGNTGKLISLMELSKIRINDFIELTGKKMNFSEKLSFKIAQKQLRSNINYDGSFKTKKFEKFLKKKGDGEGFHAGGFFLGFLLGLIGVLISYLINDDKKRNRVKWAWIGLGVWIGILLIILAAGGTVF